MYKNILFDLGGVVIDFAPRLFLVDHFVNEALENKLFDITFGSEEWKQMDAGLLSREAGNKRMREQATALGCSYEVEMILNDWDDMLRTKEDTTRLMKRLRQNGYRLFYLSNIAHDTLALMKQRHFWPLFSGGVASCDARILKPDPRIFNGTLRKFQLLPSETIFVDDTPINVQAAQECGITALHFTSASTLARNLAALGIKTTK